MADADNQMLELKPDSISQNILCYAKCEVL